jgi:hypothetical protein
MTSQKVQLTDITVLCCIMEHFSIKYGLCWMLVGPQDVTGHTACADGTGSGGAE